MRSAGSTRSESASWPAVARRSCREARRSGSPWRARWPREPELLLLDEPLAALDVAVLPALRQTLRRVLADRTAIVVTHDPLDALLLADRVVVLSDGRVVEEGASAEVLSRPRSPFAARLAGLNLVAGTWRDGGVETSDGLRVHGLVEGEPPALGQGAIATFRPSAVAVFRDPVEGSPRNAFQVTLTEIEPLADLDPGARRLPARRRDRAGGRRAVARGRTAS